MFCQIIRLSYALSSSSGECHGVDSLINNIPLSVPRSFAFHEPANSYTSSRSLQPQRSETQKLSGGFPFGEVQYNNRVYSIDLTRGPLYPARDESRVNVGE